MTAAEDVGPRALAVPWRPAEGLEADDAIEADVPIETRNGSRRCTRTCRPKHPSPKPKPRPKPCARSKCSGIGFSPAPRFCWRFYPCAASENARPMWPIASLETPARLPPASVIVPVKGEDEGLRENLAALASLDYPDYELIVAARSAADIPPGVLPQPRQDGSGPR